MATLTTISRTNWPPFLTFRQMQEDLGIDREQVFHLATTRNFPLVKTGRTYRIPCKALVRWLVQEADLPHGRNSAAQTGRRGG
jgi:hypothetical protein